MMNPLYRLPRRAALRVAIVAAALASLVACSSPEAPRYHTLLPSAGEVAVAPAAAAPLGAAWELAPVRVPPQVDQPQYAVRAADDTMALLEQERWVAPLGSEIKAALADALGHELGSQDGVKLNSQQQQKPWRIRVDVQRFDSVPGRYARLEATWLLTPGDPAKQAVSCSSAFQVPVAAGYPALSAGHRKAVVQLGAAIGKTLRQVDSTGSAACPTPQG